MKAIRTLVIAAATAAMMAATVDVQAAGRHGGGGYRGGGHGGGHWGGHGGHYRGHRGSGWGLYWGLPLAFGAAFAYPYYGWGYPYYGWGYPYYDGPRVVYREVIREPEVIETERIAEPTTEVPRTEGSPTHGPLYMNYCASSKAYYPKVTSCPEGWKFISPVQ